MEYNLELLKLQDSIVRKRKLKNKLEETKKELNTLIKKEEKLKLIEDSENQDVIDLKDNTLASTIKYLFSNKEEVLGTQEKEARIARIKHQECLEELVVLNKIYEDTAKELQTIGNVEEDFIELLKQKKEYLKQYSTVSDKIISIEEEIFSLKSELKEIQEAISSGNRVIINIENVKNSLDSANGWSYLDMFGGGLISSLAKHNDLDKSKKYINELKRNIEDFKYELNDVSMVSNINVEISSILGFTDIFFDNIFVDFVVHDKIQETKYQIEKANEEVTNALSHLKNLKDNDETRVIVLINDLQELVVKTEK